MFSLNTSLKLSNVPQKIHFELSKPQLPSIVTAQPQQMNLQATQEADFYIHIYFNSFKQLIVLNSYHKARKDKT